MKRLGIALLVLLCVYLATGVFFVQPDEQAVVRRFGAVTGLSRTPGAHFGLPWGLDRVDHIKPGEIKRVAIGPADMADIAVGAASAQYLTGDRNLVTVRATVHYTIDDPRLYLFQHANVDRLLASAGQTALTEALAAQSVDWALTSGKSELGVVLVDQLQRILDPYGLGIRIRSVDVGAVEPPAEVSDAFADVISALRERERSIHQAHSFRNKTLAQAEAESQRIIDRGRADRDRSLRQAQGDADRFASLLVEYQQAPDLTASRLYLETIADVLPRFRSKLFVDQGSEVDLSILREEQP